MKSLAKLERRRLLECKRKEIAAAAVAYRASILKEPLIQIGFSTGMLKHTSFNAGGRGFDIAAGRATKAQVLIDAQSLMEDKYRSRLRHFEESDPYKALFYSGWEPSSCVTGERSFWM